MVSQQNPSEKPSKPVYIVGCIMVTFLLFVALCSFYFSTHFLAGPATPLTDFSSAVVGPLIFVYPVVAGLIIAWFVGRYKKAKDLFERKGPKTSVQLKKEHEWGRIKKLIAIILLLVICMYFMLK